MKRDNTRSIKSIPAISNFTVWTVVSLVDDRISSSIHASEHEAYCEAVSRYKSAELRSANAVLISLVETASRCGDYQEVRKYIENNACRISMMQLAEHNMNDLNGYQVRTPRLAQANLQVALGALA